MTTWLPIPDDCPKTYVTWRCGWCPAVNVCPYKGKLDTTNYTVVVKKEKRAKDD